ncbi:MAG TPA: glycosyltransferase family 39 protein [Patescibacteria group bacterium]|nr:glycosyltransferase family 39 protein [Patescibacteria group bacterium]
MKSRHAAAALLVVFFLLVSAATGTKSATYDESVHIFSGWRILTQGDFATNHEHPPLMKALAALPLVIMGASPPRTEMKRESDEWNVAHDFVYHANDGDRILRAARLPIALVATAMACAVYGYTAAAMGTFAGLVALALLVFEPNILAHSGFVTTDLGNAAMTFFTFAAFVTWLRRRSRGWLIGTGVLLGLALLTRFTAVLLVPILAICGVIHVVLEGRGRWRDLAVGLSLIALIGVAVLNLGYGFGGSFSTLKSFTPESQKFREYAAGPLGGVPLPVPLEYVRGFDHAEASGQRWWSYLFGQYSMTGWRHYYLAALAVKTPLPLLLLTGAGLLFWMRRGKDGLDPIQALLPQVPLLVYLFAFTLSGNLKNIGLRYILPVYPFMCIVAAMTTRIDFDKAWRARLVCAMVAWQVAVAAWMYPDYLTFFNLTVGGPSRGAEVLLDSNLDWGQDLKGLGRFISEKRIDKIYVDYFGRACLRYYGVRSTPDFEGGYIAVSATNLKGVYAEDKDRYRFLWSQTPAAVIGGSIFVYDTSRPADWKPKATAAGD